jgi:hypothetical protein
MYATLDVHIVYLKVIKKSRRYEKFFGSVKCFMGKESE